MFSVPPTGPSFDMDDDEIDRMLGLSQFDPLTQSWTISSAGQLTQDLGSRPSTQTTEYHDWPTGIYSVNTAADPIQISDDEDEPLEATKRSIQNIPLQSTFHKPTILSHKTPARNHDSVKTPTPQAEILAKSPGSTTSGIKYLRSIPTLTDPFWIDEYETNHVDDGLEDDLLENTGNWLFVGDNSPSPSEVIVLEVPTQNASPQLDKATRENPTRYSQDHSDDLIRYEPPKPAKKAKETEKILEPSQSEDLVSSNANLPIYNARLDNDCPAEEVHHAPDSLMEDVIPSEHPGPSSPVVDKIAAHESVQPQAHETNNSGVLLDETRQESPGIIQQQDEIPVCGNTTLPADQSHSNTYQEPVQFPVRPEPTKLLDLDEARELCSKRVHTHPKPKSLASALQRYQYTSPSENKQPGHGSTTLKGQATSHSSSHRFPNTDSLATDPSWSASKPRTASQKRKSAYETSAIPLNRVTAEDWMIVKLFKEEQTWPAVSARLYAETGQMKTPKVLTRRYKKMQTTFPHEIPASDTSTTPARPVDHPRHPLPTAIGERVSPQETARTNLAVGQSNGKISDHLLALEQNAEFLEHHNLTPANRDEARGEQHYPTAAGRERAGDNSMQKIEKMMEKVMEKSIDRVAETVMKRMKKTTSVIDEDDDTASLEDQTTSDEVISDTERECSPVNDDDMVHWIYVVKRRTYHENHTEVIGENGWQLVSPESTNLAEASERAFKNMMREPEDEHVWPLVEWHCVCDDAHRYLPFWRGRNQEGFIVEVKVTRRLNTFFDGQLPESKRGWLPRQVWDVMEKRVQVVEVTEEFEEKEAENDVTPIDPLQENSWISNEKRPTELSSSASVQNQVSSESSKTQEWKDGSFSSSSSALTSSIESFETAGENVTGSQALRVFQAAKVVRKNITTSSDTQMMAVGGMHCLLEEANRLAAKRCLELKRDYLIPPNKRMRLEEIEKSQKWQKEMDERLKDLQGDIDEEGECQVGLFEEETVVENLEVDVSVVNADGVTRTRRERLSITVGIVQRFLSSPRNF